MSGAIRAGAIVGVLFMLLTGFSSTAQTANLTMATPAKVGRTTATINAAALAPTGCAAIAAGLASVQVANAATFNAGNQANLVLGRNAATTLNGQNGNDCIVGGQNADTLTGGNNTDVCLGGPGTDTFNSCEDPQQQ